MDENSRRTKKTRAGTVLPNLDSLAIPAARGGAKPKRRAARAAPADDPACKSEQMRVIEGGAHKRAPDLKDHIGRQLRAVYDDVLHQPVPSRFMDLLHELASKPKPGDR